jgi:hypothetical protein
VDYVESLGLCNVVFCDFSDTLLSANWLPPLGAWCAERGLTPSAGGW